MLPTCLRRLFPGDTTLRHNWPQTSGSTRDTGSNTPAGMTRSGAVDLATPERSYTYFDGTNDYAYASTSFAYTTSNMTYSLVLMMRSVATIPPADVHLFLFTDGGMPSPANYDHSLMIKTGTGYANLYHTGGANANTTSTINVCDGRWHLLVGTYDFSNTWLYVDGVPAAINTNGGSTYMPFSSATTFGFQGVGSSYTQIDMGESALFNRPLSPVEVFKIWTNLRNQPYRSLARMSAFNRARSFALVFS